MKKVAVFGAQGQLGCELQLTQPDGLEVTYLTRAQVDIANIDQVADCLNTLNPAVIINAAAYTAVDRAEQEPHLAEAANAVGPGNLAEWAGQQGARLLHVSTDFVFDGLSAMPYKVSDPPNPLGVYGQTKLTGEKRVLATDGPHLVLRTGWVYSRHGGNFVKTMLRLMSEREQIAVVDDQTGTPTWARGLASTCWALASNPDTRGLYHWSDKGSCSWFEFALAIQEEALTLGLLDRKIEVLPISTTEYPTPARRPAYSVLDKTETWRAIGDEGQPWREALQAMLRDLASSL